MSTTTTDRAREIAAGYISPATGDAEMTRFATTGHADGYELLQCIEHSARVIDGSDQYSDDERAVIRAELDYLRTWVREFHGRYAVSVYTTVYGPWDADENGDPVGDERPELDSSGTVIMFDTLRDVARYLTREGLQEPSTFPCVVPDLGIWLSLTNGPRVSGWDGLATGNDEDVTAHPEYGFTDRTWGAVLATVTR
jgi:hypothetical protein